MLRVVLHGRRAAGRVLGAVGVVEMAHQRGDALRVGVREGVMVGEGQRMEGADLGGEGGGEDAGWADAAEGRLRRRSTGGAQRKCRRQEGRRYEGFAATLSEAEGAPNAAVFISFYLSRSRRSTVQG